jgi:hypothetical protein
VYRGDAGELPLQPDRPDESGAGELVIVDVVHLQPAGIGVAQQEIGFAGHAAEIADARELPLEAIAPMEAALVIALLAMS